MKKIILVLALMFIVSNSVSAVSMSRSSSFSSSPSYSSTRSYSNPSYSTPRSSSFTSTSTKSNISSTPVRSNVSSTQYYNSSDSLFTPTNFILFYMLTQNNHTQKEIDELQKIVEKKGYNTKGNWFYTAEGFDINGFTANGSWWYSKDGYDINGYNAIGINKEGKKFK